MLGYWANRTTVNKANMCVPYALQDGYPLSNFKHVYKINWTPMTPKASKFPKRCRKVFYHAVKVKNAQVKIF